MVTDTRLMWVVVLVKEWGCMIKNVVSLEYSPQETLHADSIKIPSICFPYQFLPFH